MTDDGRSRLPLPGLQGERRPLSVQEGLRPGGDHRFQTPHQGREEKEPQLLASHLSSPTSAPCGQNKSPDKGACFKRQLKEKA